MLLYIGLMAAIFVFYALFYGIIEKGVDALERIADALEEKQKDKVS